jgi:hypothetical protein
MLAAGAHFVDYVTTQVDGRIARHPDIATRQQMADQCLP